MIDVYSWPTPNGHKIHILLEEIQLPYTLHAIDIGIGQQYTKEFLLISPNNKIPAITDSDGPEGKPISLFESGAILMYLASKSNFGLPKDVRARYEILQWLMFQMASIGPMLGQAHHFRQYAPEKIEYAIKRYTQEARRLYGVLETRLCQSDYIVGKEYTIADIAIWPWIRSWKMQGIDLRSFPKVAAWFKKIEQRPGVQCGIALLSEKHRPLQNDMLAREVLFGNAQQTRH